MRRVYSRDEIAVLSIVRVRPLTTGEVIERAGLNPLRVENILMLLSGTSVVRMARLGGSRLWWTSR